MTPRVPVLVIEDDAGQRQMLVELLSQHGFDAQGADGGRAGVELAVRLKPAVVILDLQMPDMDGFAVCRLLKADRRTRATPILMLTANATPENHLASVEHDADHFLAKPVTDFALFARWVKALAAKSGGGGKRLTAGPVTADPEDHTVRVGAAPAVPLPPKLFAILAELMRRPGEILAREYLVDRVWGNAVRDREVDVAMSRLRTLLGPRLGGALVAVPGKGYRLDLTRVAP